MENIYENDTIKLVILSLIRSKKLNYRRVSEAAEIHPSYFSRVLKGNAFFSQAQIFRLSEVFSLTENEKDYFMLLWQKEGAVTPNERHYFKKKIELIRDEKQKLKQRIAAKPVEDVAKSFRVESYYEDAMTAIVHMYLTIPEYRNKPAKILEKLPFGEARLWNEIEKLNSIGLLEIRNDKIEKVEDSIHLPEESKYSFLNHVNWRLQSIQNIQSRQKKIDDYYFSAVFSADEETKKKIKKIILDTIVTIGKNVNDCPTPKAVFHLGFDLWER